MPVSVTPGIILIGTSRFGRKGGAMAYSAVHVSNNILKRAFDENVAISPMALQKMLYFVASEYAKRTGGRQLLEENFRPWRYGPVVRSVYDEFRAFGGGSIRAFGKDAQERAYMAKESKDPVLTESLNTVWNAAKHRSAVALSRITHNEGSAWSKGYARGWISHEDIASDASYRVDLGL